MGSLSEPRTRTRKLSFGISGVTLCEDYDDLNRCCVRERRIIEQEPTEAKKTDCIQNISLLPAVRRGHTCKPL